MSKGNKGEGVERNDLYWEPLELNQGFVVTKPAEIPVRAALLMDRVIAFDQFMPNDLTIRSRNITSGVFDEAQAIVQEAENLSVLLGMKQSPHKGVEFDYSFPSYEEFRKEEEKIFQGMLELPDSAFQFFMPGPIAAIEVSDGPLIYRAGETPSTPTGTRKWLAKLFAALGVGSIWQALLEVLEEGWAELFHSLGLAIKRRDWRSVKFLLRRLLNIFTSPAFRAKLIKKIGASAAAKLIGKILGRLLPFVGWALIIGTIVWAIVEQFI
ncbi:hypothetical protein ACFLYX_02615 [Chloroflexota bacterium]